MFENKNIKLGIAPIGWTNDDMPQLGGNITFEQCISEISLAGFDGTEIGSKFPTNARVLKKAMDLRNIKIASQWFGSYLASSTYEKNEKKFIEQLMYLEDVGANRINVCELTRCLFDSKQSMFENKPILDEQEWEKLCRGLNKLGKIATERGFKLCFHHHMGTVVQTRKETRRLLENTDKCDVYICFDTGHFIFSGENEVETCNEFADRIGHVHLKDIRPCKMQRAIKKEYYFRKAVLENCFTIPGEGFGNFKSVFEILDKCGYEGWFVVEAEQDPEISNPFENALKARQYIKKNTGI